MSKENTSTNTYHCTSNFYVSLYFLPSCSFTPRTTSNSCSHNLKGTVMKKRKKEKTENCAGDLLFVWLKSLSTQMLGFGTTQTLCFG